MLHAAYCILHACDGDGDGDENEIVLEIMILVHRSTCT